MVDFVNEHNKRMENIETKLRNSIQAIKTDNIDLKKKVEVLIENLKTVPSALESFRVSFSKKIEEVIDKIELDERVFDKFKKDISKDILKKEILKEVLPLFNEKIDVGLRIANLENREIKKELNDFKNRWTSSSDEKINLALEEFHLNFEKLSKEMKEEMKRNRLSLEKQKKQLGLDLNEARESLRKETDAQNKLIDKYSAKLEEYSLVLEKDYNKSKKEIVTSTQKACELQNERITNLENQIKYLMGKLDKEKSIKPTIQVNRKGIFNKIVESLAD